jgi:glycosyltransferase involved in cell wall biosynthesis
MPLVSVIMPSFNHSKYIEEAIGSVLNQSMDDLELIIIDDASHDNSRNIITRLSENDKRIKTKFNQKNMGIASVLNQAISYSKGKYIAFIASDDLWTPSKLKRQLEVLNNNNDLILWCEGKIIDSGGEEQTKNFTEYYEVPKKSGSIFEELIKGNYIFGSSIVLKTENLRELMLDERLTYLNDHKLYLDLAYKYKYYFIPDPLAKYRIHGKNTTFKNISEWNKDAMVLSEYLLAHYGADLSLKTKKNIFYLACRNPIHHCLNMNEGNKMNLVFYSIVLPLWYFFIVTKSFIRD